MANILCMKISDAYEKSRSSALADLIWKHKHPKEKVDCTDREYNSWLKSTKAFLEVVVRAGLGELEVVFELPTPLGDYIDVALLGHSKWPKDDETGRMLIVELKQWSAINQIDDKDYVEISVGNGKYDKRRHPISQICEYKSHMENNHHGIYKNGKVCVDTVAYLHNFPDKSELIENKYFAWKPFAEKIYAEKDTKQLIEYLQSSFKNIGNGTLSDIVDDCGYVMDEAGFSGLKAALEGKENAKMVKDQMAVVDCVREHLKEQKTNPHKEIMVVSGGPGTGKTIIGMHFIYDYAEIFNDKHCAYGAVFCLPGSRTVKAMIDNECRSEVVPYLDGINCEQNLVVVDESHRITGIENTLDRTFNKGTKLLILLQDDHQRIRPGEDGTLDGIKAYARKKGIKFTPLNLTIQKRCESLGRLLDGLDKMFYGQGSYDGISITSVRVFDKLADMDEWIKKLSAASRAKFIAPYCWAWNGKDNDVKIAEESFEKSWNPNAIKDQVTWYYGTNKAEEVAGIYTCQGLDFDDVAFIWWNDLIWDENAGCWKADIGKSRDSAFVQGVRRAGLSQAEIDELFINTYYVMLSRARNKMGIWFKDAATKRHVMECLGLGYYSSADIEFISADGKNTVVEERTVENHEMSCESLIIGNNANKTYHKPNCQYAPRNLQKRVEFKKAEDAKKDGYKPCWTCNP